MRKAPKFEDKLIFPYEDCYPMFLGPGTKADQYGFFPYREEADKSIIYSTFPIIVHSDRVPNVYFTFAKDMEYSPRENEMKRGFFSIFEKFKNAKKTYREYEKNPIIDDYNLIYLDDIDFNDTNRLLYIIQNILNPRGIGVFFPKGSSYFFPSVPKIKKDFDWVQRHELKLIPIPYTIEIVKKMLFNDNQEINDFDGYSVTSLYFLKYPLPNVIIPRPNVNNLRERFICFSIMMNNPPQFDKNKYKNYQIKNYQPGENNNELISDIPQYQWVYVYVRNPSKDARIIVGDIDGEMISLLGDFPKKYKIELMLDRGTNSTQYFSIIGNQTMYIVGQNEETEIVVFVRDIK